MITTDLHTKQMEETVYPNGNGAALSFDNSTHRCNGVIALSMCFLRIRRLPISPIGAKVGMKAAHESSGNIEPRV